MVKQKSIINSLLAALGVSFCISAGAILLSWLLFLLTGDVNYYLLALIAVALSAWFGGVTSGFITIILTTLAITYIFLPQFTQFSHQQIPLLIDLVLFFLAGLIINTIIDKKHITNDVLVYKQKEKEYLELLTHMQQENKRYQKEVQARDEFLSIASHELKTPLAAMLLQIQTALHNIRNVSLANFSVEKLLKMLQSTEQQSKRLSKTINDLLNVSLITTGRLELEKEEVNLSQLVKDVVDRFAERAEREGSPINLKTNGPVMGKWDKLRIEQAVTNLISNAIKYGANEPISVDVRKENGFGRITVTDRGIGIPTEGQERIFERFERAVSNHSYKGLGVGLYITQQIVKTHLGRITVKSRPNSGSVFTIELPLPPAKMPQAVSA